MQIRAVSFLPVCASMRVRNGERDLLIAVTVDGRLDVLFRMVLKKWKARLATF